MSSLPILSPSRLHRFQGVAGMLLLLTLALPWLRRTSEVGDSSEWVYGFALAAESDLGDGRPIPYVLAVLVVVAVLVVGVTAMFSWWRRSMGAAMLAGLSGLVTTFLVVGVSSRGRGLDSEVVAQQIAPGLVLAVLLCAAVVVSCLALMTTVTPPRG